MYRHLLLLLCACLTLFPLPAFTKEATPPCFYELERNFFNRKNVIEALSFARVQQGMWELIAIELEKRSPSIHRELKKRARLLQPDPLEEPFNMEKSKKLLEEVLIEDIKAAFILYDVYRESDVMVTFNFLRDRQKRLWQECKLKEPAQSKQGKGFSSGT